MMRLSWKPCVPLALVVLSLPSSVGAQSAQDFMSDARAAFEARMSGIENYTVVQNMMGMETTTRFVRSEVNGMLNFVPEQVVVEGTEAPESSAAFDQGAIYSDEYIARMNIEGTSEVDGTACTVIAITDFDGLDFGAMTGGREDFKPREMSMCMDADDYLVRRVQMAGEVNMEGQATEMTTTMVMTDYRDVDGVLHPFRTELTMTGLDQALGGREGEAAAALAEMQRRMDELPEAQRRMMEAQMEAMSAMLDMASGSATVIETLEVRVNTPGG